MTIKSDAPIFACFCHCVSCRKTHSAPLYQCVYVTPDEITIEGGMDESNPHLASWTRGSRTAAKCGQLLSTLS